MNNNNNNNRYSNTTRPRARSSYSYSSSSSSSSSSSNHYRQPPPPPPPAAAATTAPSTDPSHGSLLVSTPWRGFEYFPQFVGEEGGSHSYTNSQVCHVWNLGNVNYPPPHSLTFFPFITFSNSSFSSSFSSSFL